MNRRTKAILFVAVTIPIGIAWRMAPLHLPFFAWKYGGSVLWTFALYGCVVAVLPRLRPGGIAELTALLALLVELSRLVHQPLLNAFRETLAGKLILGRIFSFKDIAAYWLATALLFSLDRALSKQHPTTPAQ